MNKNTKILITIIVICFLIIIILIFRLNTAVNNINRFKKIDYQNYSIDNNVVRYYIKKFDKHIPVPLFSIYYGDLSFTSLIFYSYKSQETLKEELTAIFNSDYYEKVYTNDDQIYYYNSTEDYTITSYDVIDKENYRYISMSYHNGYIK